MSLIEKARERLEEVRIKGPMVAIKELRGNPGNPGDGILEKARERLEAVRTKGVLGALGGSSSPALLTVLGEKFPRVKEIRERGILAEGPFKVPTKEAPAAPPTPKPTMYPAAPEAPVKVDLMMKPRLY